MDSDVYKQQISQLWDMVEKQRSLIFDLREELDRVKKEKETLLAQLSTFSTHSPPSLTSETELHTESPDLNVTDLMKSFSKTSLSSSNFNSTGESMSSPTTTTASLVAGTTTTSPSPSSVQSFPVASSPLSSSLSSSNVVTTPLYSLPPISSTTSPIHLPMELDSEVNTTTSVSTPLTSKKTLKLPPRTSSVVPAHSSPYSPSSPSYLTPTKSSFSSTLNPSDPPSFSSSTSSSSLPNLSSSLNETHLSHAPTSLSSPSALSVDALTQPHSNQTKTSENPFADSNMIVTSDLSTSNSFPSHTSMDVHPPSSSQSSLLSSSTFSTMTPSSSSSSLAQEYLPSDFTNDVSVPLPPSSSSRLSQFNAALTPKLTMSTSMPLTPTTTTTGSTFETSEKKMLLSPSSTSSLHHYIPNSTPLSQSQLSLLRTSIHLLTLPIVQVFIKPNPKGKETMYFIISIRKHDPTLAPNAYSSTHSSSSNPTNDNHTNHNHAHTNATSTSSSNTTTTTASPASNSHATSGPVDPDSAYTELWCVAKRYQDFALLEQKCRSFQKQHLILNQIMRLPEKSFFSLPKDLSSTLLLMKYFEPRKSALSTFLSQLLQVISASPFIPITTYLIEFLTTDLQMEMEGSVEDSKEGAFNSHSNTFSSPSSGFSRLLKRSGPFSKKDKKPSPSSSSSRTTTTTSGGLGLTPKSAPIFGAPLEEAIKLSKSSIDPLVPSIVLRCIAYLDAHEAHLEEGIYRLSGSSVTIRHLKDIFDSEGDLDLLNSDEYYDVHAISGLLKLYLRELPSPILTEEYHPHFLALQDVVDLNERVALLAPLVQRLPGPNYSLLRALLHHFSLIAQHSEVNRMNPRNMSIVFAPTLGIPAGVFSTMLTDFDRVFKTPPPPSSPSINSVETTSTIAAPASTLPPLPPPPPSSSSSSHLDSSSPPYVAPKSDRRKTVFLNTDTDAFPSSSSSSFTSDPHSSPPLPTLSSTSSSSSSSSSPSSHPLRVHFPTATTTSSTPSPLASSFSETAPPCVPLDPISTNRVSQYILDPGEALTFMEFLENEHDVMAPTPSSSSSNTTPMDSKHGPTLSNNASATFPRMTGTPSSYNTMTLTTDSSNSSNGTTPPPLTPRTSSSLKPLSPKLARLLTIQNPELLSKELNSLEPDELTNLHAWLQTRSKKTDPPGSSSLT